MAAHLTNDQTQQIAEALAHGSKIEAIKLYRQFSGTDLKEAKDFVEALIPQLVKQDPGKYAKLSQTGKGCVTLTFACIGLAVTPLIRLFQ